MTGREAAARGGGIRICCLRLDSKNETRERGGGCCLLSRSPISESREGRRSDSVTVVRL